MDYTELNIILEPKDPWSEILVAQLSEIGFDSFVETEEGVQAYIPSKDFNLDDLKSNTLLFEKPEGVSISFSQNEIPHQNWNEVWESGFEPVFVDELVTIRAPFHTETTIKGLDIVIQPQMSFGTGHHETTWLMSKSLFDLNPFPSKVLDMGTGTGVLAIIAEKLGAQSVLAVDIEDWSVENTKENITRNLCNQIQTICGDIDVVDQKDFDVILANINKNVLKAHLPFYAEKLSQGGKLYMSGFFETDIDELVFEAKKYNLDFVSHKTKDSWACILLNKL
ncbi:MAG: 50S ribosomal protein L11 methyltransferase [Crocinitomicaceae bacterium]